MKFQPGDIAFSIHSKNPISKAIAWFTGSRWSHTILIVEHSKYIYTSETSDFEVVMHTLDDSLNDPTVIMEVFRADLSPDQQKLIVEKCMENLGQTYGYFQFISLGVRALLRRWFGIKINNFIRQGVVCNQHVLYGLSQIPSLGELYGMDPESIDQQELYEKVVSIKDQMGKPIFKKVHEKC
jgi:hypothetical protein